MVYESHGFAPAVGEDLPHMLSTARGLSPSKRRRLEARERLVWRRAGGYITITAALARELEGRFGPRPHLAVVPDGARVPAVEDVGLRQTAATSSPVVGYAGHLYPWKGPDVLVEAIERLPGVHALIVGGLAGEPDLERVRALAARVAPGRVTFAGQVDPPRVAGLLRQADVLALPNTPGRVSAAYTSPLKLFEYMASGRPMVASDSARAARDPAAGGERGPGRGRRAPERWRPACRGCSATRRWRRASRRRPARTCGSGPGRSAPGASRRCSRR